jgi:Zn-dependent metalloprotease
LRAHTALFHMTSADDELRAVGAEADDLREARAAALVDAQAARPDVDESAFSTRAPKLWIWAPPSGAARLAWRVETDVRDLARPLALVTFIDALDGSVLERGDTINYLDGSGVGFFGDRKPLAIDERRDLYWLEDPTRGSLKTYSGAGRQTLPGAGVTSADRLRWDAIGAAAGAAVDAHAYVAAAYDYFLAVHGRAGWDGRAGAIHTTVHFGHRFDRAFFNGRQLVFGDGDGAALSPLSAALEVVAHEYTHGVTFHAAHLGAQGENGALNEAIADIFACLISYGATRGRNWQIGETLFHPNGRPRPLRDLAHPADSGNPSSLDEYVVTDEDRGGVHLNSTILSHAAYLMAEGGTHARSHVHVSALGTEAAGRLWFRALTRYLASSAGFADAADATLAAARDLGSGEPSVREAWIAVGLLKE